MNDSRKNTARAIVISLMIHCLLVAILTIRWTRHESAQPQSVEVAIYPLDLSQKNPAKSAVRPNRTVKHPSKKAQPVAGLTRESTVNESNSSAKIGNTLSKAPDNLPSSEEALPPPAEDYEITDWPKLQNDVRVPYPVEAKRLDVSGIVVMDLYVDETGHVRQAKLVKGPGHGLNEAGLGAAKQFVFSPAREGGKAVPVIIRYSYRFVVQH